MHTNNKCDGSGDESVPLLFEGTLANLVPLLDVEKADTWQERLIGCGKGELAGERGGAWQLVAPRPRE
jgi:hypothetical protein